MHVSVPSHQSQRVAASPSAARARCPLASHADVAGLAAGILLGVHRGQAHQLVPADLGHRAQRQVYGLGVDHLQDDVLGVVEHQAALLVLLAGQEAVVGHVEGRQPLLAEVIAAGALGRHHQDDVVVGRVHAVEVSEVDVAVGVEERLGLHLEAVAAVGGVLRRLARVELCVAAKEDALQLPAEGRAVAAAVVLHGGQHAVLLRLPRNQDGNRWDGESHNFRITTRVMQNKGKAGLRSSRKTLQVHPLLHMLPGNSKKTPCDVTKGTNLHRSGVKSFVFDPQSRLVSPSVFVPKHAEGESNLQVFSGDNQSCKAAPLESRRRKKKS